jgi:hypothetical protein
LKITKGFKNNDFYYRYPWMRCARSYWASSM